MKYHHLVVETLKTRLRTDPKLIQVLLGPRQVGKTTAIKTFLKGYHFPFVYHSADEMMAPDPLWIERVWSEASRRDRTSLLIIDEIQKIHDWSSVIKRLWDRQSFEKKTKLKLLLTGSSSLNIQKGLAESLAGRFEIIRAYHWGYEESNAQFKISFKQYMQQGGYPGSYRLMRDSKRLETYLLESIIEPVVNKDILYHNRVKSPALFKQAFSLLCSYPAQEISYNKLLGQLQDRGNIDQIKYYIDLFEAAYLIKPLFKYSKSEIRKKASSPKILPLCPALINQTLRMQVMSGDSQLEGRFFEVLVGSDLIRSEMNPYYWREKTDEVDFVVERQGHLWAIEVKLNQEKSTLGIKRFIQKYPHATPVFISQKDYAEFEKNPSDFLENS